MHITHSIMLAVLALAARLPAETNTIEAPACPEAATGMPATTNAPAAAGAETMTNEPVTISAVDTNSALVAAAEFPPAVSAVEPKGVNILKNGDFILGSRNWRSWQYAALHTNWVAVVTKTGAVGTYRALRIKNPGGLLIGVQQTVNVEADTVYKLAGSAQSMATNSSAILFGARIGFLMQPQREQQLVWTTEFNQWWRKYVVFTNRVKGTGQVFIHMGYGKVASTGEFADVRLERIGKVEAKGRR